MKLSLRAIEFSASGFQERRITSRTSSLDRSIDSRLDRAEIRIHLIGFTLLYLLLLLYWCCCTAI